MADGRKRAVVALGGNAILSGDEGTAEEQREVVEDTANAVADAVRAGYEVVVTHGNGPQVGALMLQQEGAPDTPQMPLDVLVAETQAQIGYVLQQALRNATDTPSATVVTQVVVDSDDNAFENPTKVRGTQQGKRARSRSRRVRSREDTRRALTAVSYRHQNRTQSSRRTK
jgi:carbamate kinase